MDDLPQGTVWWGEFTLDDGERLRRRIGPFEFWLARERCEWRFGEGGPADEARASEAVAGDADTPPSPPGRGPLVRRLGFERTSARARLAPRLADRPVIVQPRHAIALPPRQELVLFISSPLWLHADVDDPPVTLVELPLQRPSDTWFGANTRHGELCYALRTSARLRLENVPDRPHRAVTELRVVNSAASELPIERIQVPMPTMSLYAGASGQLWTQVVTLERPEDDELASIELSSRPPQHLEGATLVSGPRTTTTRGNLFRAFGGLITGR